MDNKDIINAVEPESEPKLLNIKEIEQRILIFGIMRTVQSYDAEKRILTYVGQMPRVLLSATYEHPDMAEYLVPGSLVATCEYMSRYGLCALMSDHTLKLLFYV